MAELFERAHSRLKTAGFYDTDSMMVSDLNAADEGGFLEDIEEELRENDALWELDDRLAQLIPNGAK